MSKQRPRDSVPCSPLHSHYAVELSLWVSRLRSQQWHTSSSTQTELSSFCSVSCFLHSFSGLNFQILSKSIPCEVFSSISRWAGPPSCVNLQCTNSVMSEKAMAPHSSTLAWKIPWTEEPGRLQSMGSLGVGHDWATSLSLFDFMHWRRKCQPTPVFLPGESQGRGSLVGCRLWGLIESDMTKAT